MGVPKAMLPFGEEVLLQRVVRLLREVVEPVVVVAAVGQDVPQLPDGVRIVRDEVEAKGPLAGLAAGLTAVAGACDVAFLCACDAPFLQTAFVRRVLEPLASQSFDRGDKFDASVPCVGGFLHPLAAAYRVSLLPLICERLTTNRLRMLDLFECFPTRKLESHELEDADPAFASLRNINTPEEYEAALRQFGEPPAEAGE